MTETRLGITGLYTYGAYNRMTQAALNGYTYDNSGNQISKYNWDGDIWNYSYTKDNMLKTVKKNGVFKAEYFYDGDGKRIKKIENIGGSNVTTIFVYQGLNVLYEKIAENNTLTKYVFGVGKLLAQVKGGATILYLLLILPLYRNLQTW